MCALQPCKQPISHFRISFRILLRRHTLRKLDVFFFSPSSGVPTSNCSKSHRRQTIPCGGFPPVYKLDKLALSGNNNSWREVFPPRPGELLYAKQSKRAKRKANRSIKQGNRTQTVPNVLTGLVVAWRRKVYAVGKKFPFMPRAPFTATAAADQRIHKRGILPRGGDPKFVQQFIPL